MALSTSAKQLNNAPRMLRWGLRPRATGPWHNNKQNIWQFDSVGGGVRIGGGAAEA